jgi:hypothetical protein
MTPPSRAAPAAGGKGVGWPHKRAASAAAAGAGVHTMPYGGVVAGAGVAEAAALPDSFLLGSFQGSLGNLLGSFPGSTLSLNELLIRPDAYEAPGKRPAGPAPEGGSAAKRSAAEGPDGYAAKRPPAAAAAGAGA